MKVLGIISSLSDASSRARILQYGDALMKEDIKLTARYFFPDTNADPAPWAYQLNKITRINPWRFSWIQKSVSRLPLLLQQYQFDLIWQNRMVLPHQSFYERKFRKPVVGFDFDDAIWLHDGEKKVAEAIAHAEWIFAGNEYLADFAVRHNPNVNIVPSVINTDRLFPLAGHEGPFTLGWIGTTGNLRFLEMIKPAVLSFLSQHPSARFIIVSSAPEGPFAFDNDRILFRKWSAEKENDLISEFSIGLMPLPDTDYTRGKCSYKMLQYMACGKPVVVSPVGTNRTILGEGNAGLPACEEHEWTAAFSKLMHDRSFYEACSDAGRKLVEERYSVRTWYPEIAGRFRKILNQGS